MSLIPAAYIEKSWRKAMNSLEYGTLEFIAPNGEVSIHKGAHPGPSARFHIHDWDVLRRIMARGDIGRVATVLELGSQSWLLLALASAVALGAIWPALRGRPRAVLASARWKFF